ncbi:hypothetical protein DFH06DRAFT_1358623, partial [Mycena polygramma]
MTAGVHDGVAVRHVCCSVHDCKDPVPTQRSFFCNTHQDLLRICCIHGCESDAEPGFRTCSLPAHRAFQKETDLRNSAMFQLRDRLRNTG